MPWPFSSNNSDSSQQSWTQWGAQKAYDIAVPRLKKYGQQALDHVTYHTKDVLSRVPTEFVSQWHPKNIATVVQNPQEAIAHEKQIVHRFTNLADLVTHPIEHLKKHYDKPYLHFQVFRQHYQKTDSSVFGQGPFQHGGRALVEQFKDGAAGIIGSAALMMAIANLPPNRAKTKAMRDKVFPKESFLRRPFNTRFVPRVMVGTPVSRLLAIPGTIAALAMYKHLSNVGQNIDARNSLKKENPALLQSLKSVHQDYTGAKRHKSFQENLEKTSSRKK